MLYRNLDVKIAGATCLSFLTFFNLAGKSVVLNVYKRKKILKKYFTLKMFLNKLI